MESQSGQMKVSVVLPVYNCAGNLKPLFEEFISEKPQHIDLELIWVNDASTDGSMDEIYQLSSRKTQQAIVELPTNVGSYHAVIEALPKCSGDAVVVMAADGQDPPKVAFRLIDLLAESEMAAAARDKETGSMANRLFHSMMRRKVGTGASPYPLEMVAFPAARIQEIIQDPRSRLHLFYFLDQLIVEKKVMKFSKRIRTHGTSGWSLKKKILLFVQCWRLF